MQNNQMIYNEREIYITIQDTLSEEEIKLLANTIYGTEGIRYIQIGQNLKSKYINTPHFFSLYISEKLIGTYCLSERETQFNGQLITAFYGRYLSINTGFQGRGYGSLLKKTAVNYLSSITKNPHLFYSYIEENNLKSDKISKKEGFYSIANLNVLIFSRLFPKTEKKIIQEKDLEGTKKFLSVFYKNYNLLHLGHIGYQNNYFVIKSDDGELLAGVQANPVNWKIIDIPGLKGKFIMNVLPYLPLINRLFNPRKYCFLSLESLYYKDGYQNELIILIEGLLAQFKMTSALIMLDKTSTLNHLFNKKLGILDKINKKVISSVMVKNDGFPIVQDNKVPVYVSSFDFT